MDLIELSMHWDASRSRSELVSLGHGPEDGCEPPCPRPRPRASPRSSGSAPREWQHMVTGPTAVHGRQRHISWPE